MSGPRSTRSAGPAQISIRWGLTGSLLTDRLTGSLITPPAHRTDRVLVRIVRPICVAGKRGPALRANGGPAAGPVAGKATRFPRPARRGWQAGRALGGQAGAVSVAREIDAQRDGARPPRAPALVACFHGTRDPVGQREVDRLVAEVAARRPALEVLAAYLGVQQPMVGGDLIAGVTGAGWRAIVVPVFSPAGTTCTSTWPARSNAPEAPRSPPSWSARTRFWWRSWSGGWPRRAAAGGSRGAGRSRGPATDGRWPTSSGPRGTGRRLGSPVRASYLAAAPPAVADAVAATRTAGRRVSVSGYLLTAGQFASRLAGVGADVVAAPLLPDPGLADLVLSRYDGRPAAR